MSDFEDRLGRALGDGAEHAPGVVGLADAARTRARQRRVRRTAVVGVAAAAVALALAVPFGLTPGGDAGQSRPSAPTKVGEVGDGWKTLGFEREGRVGDVTVLVDVPDSWTTLTQPDGACVAYDVGAPQDGGCALDEVLGVLADTGNLDYTYGPGLVAGADYPYPVESEWIGHVDLDGVYVNVASDDQQVALRVLGSARLEGQTAPDLSDGWTDVVSNGIRYPLPQLAVADGYGVTVAPRRSAEEYLDPEQVDDSHWQASITIGDSRITAVAPTSAIAQLIVGSARPSTETFANVWRTVTYEGDPADESGDRRLIVDLPLGWGRLDTSACATQAARYGPTDTDPCDVTSTVTIAENLDVDTPPGVAGDGSPTGYAFAGSLVAVVDAPDYETARRILASVRLPGERAPSATWRTETGDRYEVQVPDDDSVSIELVTSSGAATLFTGPARRQTDGTWTALVARKGNEARVGLVITAPTQALADVVGSTVRPAD